MRASYPFKEHFICLLPVMAMLCGIQLFLGSEEEIFRYFVEVNKNHPSYTPLMEIFTHGALFAFYPVYIFFLLRGLRGRKVEDILFTLCYLIAQLAIAVLLCRIVKIVVGRPRPMTGGPLKQFSFGWGYQSFPSGHIGEIIGSSLPLIWWDHAFSRYLLPLGFGFIIAAVAFSRIYLRMHYPSDIWGGLVLGSLSGYSSWVLYNYMHARWRRLLPEKITARLNAWLTDRA
jgi:undecaprenyl-diphosphatase